MGQTEFKRQNLYISDVFKFLSKDMTLKSFIYIRPKKESFIYYANEENIRNNYYTYHNYVPITEYF